MSTEIRFIPSCFSNIPWSVAESGIQFVFSPYDCSPQLYGDDPQIVIAMPEQVFVPRQCAVLPEVPLAMTYQLPSRVYWVLKDAARVHVADTFRGLTRHAVLSIDTHYIDNDFAIPDERFSSTALSGGWEIYNIAQFCEFPSCTGEYRYNVNVTMGNELQSNIATVLIHILAE